MCALMSTDKGAGMQMGDTRVPPSAQSKNWALNGEEGFKWGDHFKRWGWFRQEPHPQACNLDQLGWATPIRDITGDTPDSVENYFTCMRYVHRNPNSALPVKDQKYGIIISRTTKNLYRDWS